MKNPFAVRMRRGEIIGGILFFLMYQFGIGSLLLLVLPVFGLSTDEASINGAFYVLNFVITAVLFRRFLADSLPLAAHSFLRFLKSIFLGFACYEVLQIATVLLISLVAPETVAPNDETVRAIAEANYNIMFVGAVLLAPIVEETLIRGLIFSNLRRKSRPLAYVLTALVFAAMHTLPFLGEMDLMTLGMNVLLYGLPSVALCVSYEYSGTIWSPILLHMIINALAMGAM